MQPWSEFALPSQIDKGQAHADVCQSLDSIVHLRICAASTALSDAAFMTDAAMLWMPVLLLCCLRETKIVGMIFMTYMTF